MANVNFNGQSASGGANSLNQLTDVNITSPSDDQVLTYDNGDWVNKEIPDSADVISYDNTTSGLTADNVQEALDEIETNVETKANSADVPLKTQISNPNLLDNPWFTVNQRGQSSYTAGNAGDYSVDRWRVRNGTLTVNSDGTVRFLGSNTSGTDVVQSFVQNIERDFYDNYIMGRTTTFSLMFSDETIKSVTIVAPSSGATSYAIVGNYCLLINVLTSIVWIAIDQLDRSQQMDITLKAVKLEIGSVSTLALDTAPNYATELLKCQRYFVRLNSNNTSTVAGFCVNGSNNANRFGLPLPVPMRTTPTLSYSNLSDFKVSKSDGASGVVPTAIVKNGTQFGTLMETTFTATGTNTGDIAVLYCMNNTGYLDFSADL